MYVAGLHVKKDTGAEEIYVDQLRSEVALQLGHPLAQIHELANVTTPQRRPQRPPADTNAIVFVFFGKVGILLQGEYDELIPARPQRRQQPARRKADTSYGRPESL
jgi:hypothetical protein